MSYILKMLMSFLTAAASILFVYTFWESDMKIDPDKPTFSIEVGGFGSTEVSANKEQINPIPLQFRDPFKYD